LTYYLIVLYLITIQLGVVLFQRNTNLGGFSMFLTIKRMLSGVREIPIRMPGFAWHCIKTTGYSRTYQLDVPRYPKFVNVLVEFDNDGYHLVSVERVRFHGSTLINDWDELRSYLRGMAWWAMRLDLDDSKLVTITDALSQHVSKVARQGKQ